MVDTNKIWQNQNTEFLTGHQKCQGKLDKKLRTAIFQSSKKEKMELQGALEALN